MSPPVLKSACFLQLKHLCQMVFLYPESIAWQHVAVPRAKTPGAPGSSTRCDVHLVLEVRSDEAAAAQQAPPWPVAPAAAVAAEGTPAKPAGGEAAEGAPAAAADTPQKSMLALRAEMAHRLAMHYRAAYECASGRAPFNATLARPALASVSFE